MKRILFLIVFMLISAIGFAQQDPMYTQYMYNTLSINPGYAGSRGNLSITGLVRQQWVGINGAPSTQSLSLHSPIYNDNMGLGLSIVNDKVGPIHQTMLFADYSYSLDATPFSKFAFGLKVGFNILQANLPALKRNNPGDLAITVSDETIAQQLLSGCSCCR